MIQSTYYYPALDSNLYGPEYAVSPLPCDHTTPLRSRTETHRDCDYNRSKRPKSRTSTVRGTRPPPWCLFMATDASAGDHSKPSTSSIDRAAELDKLASRLDTAIEEAERKIDSGRVYDAEKERVRQGWIKALAYVVNVRRQVTNDAELQELSDRVEQLEREGRL